ncbi:energy transducer TonB, partial [Azotobacter chroococcum]|nr:energy transducer TonB [Azotobacter chroococcum]
MTAASPPPVPARPGVRPADRLGLTLVLAALLHLALILGLGFELPKPAEVSKTLEITL